MPTLPATVTAGTWWNTSGVNSNESRTRFAPTASRADSSSSQSSSNVALAAPPTTQNGRELSAAWLRVSEPFAVKRPINADAQGRASNLPRRNRNGQASKLAASSPNAALPPCVEMSVRHARPAPSQTAGDQSAARSTPTVAKAATPGMAPGAGPNRAWAPSWKPKVWRPRGACDSGLALLGCSSAGWNFASSGGLDGAGSTREPAATAVGSSVTAMMSATASAASPQLSATTRRTERGLRFVAKTTFPTTVPEGATENCARTLVAPTCSNFTRGERACTRAINSARVVQSGLASSSRLALGASVCAAAAGSQAQLLTVAKSKGVRRNAMNARVNGTLTP